MKSELFQKNNIESYNSTGKKLFALWSFLIILLITIFVLLYLFLFRHSDFFLIKYLEGFLKNITFHITNGTMLGALYASLFGGLFFVFMPMEAVFISFINGGNNPFLLVALFILGFFFSFTANYYIGMRLADISKKIITPKKFYKIKGMINKHGGMAILFFNMIPLMPAQPVSAIVGVFKYNKARFYFYFLLGEIIKYSLIATVYIYII